MLQYQFSRNIEQLLLVTFFWLTETQTPKLERVLTFQIWCFWLCIPIWPSCSCKFIVPELFKQHKLSNYFSVFLINYSSYQNKFQIKVIHLYFTIHKLHMVSNALRKLNNFSFMWRNCYTHLIWTNITLAQ
jgi:hypothetical protein